MADTATTHPISARAREPGPKRLLALDGGGIRGLVTLGYLARIEALLRERFGDPNLVLSDYFDLVGGTSTGSVIAAGIALGWPIDKLRGLYHQVGRDAFTPKKSWLGVVGRALGAKFDERPLEVLLRQHFGERELGSADLRSGLMVVVKRADTGSVWVLVNNPEQPFFEMNRHMKLWEVIRASTAAPTYFRPRSVSDVGGGERAVFVDGGVSMHCNPALQLFMVATLAGFGFGWPAGDDSLLLCSVGTGHHSLKARQADLEGYTNLHWAGLLISQLMADAAELNETLLQWLSNSPTQRPIDRQIGSLEHDVLGGRPLLTYLRYDVQLEEDDLQKVGLRYSAERVAELREMSNTANIADLDSIGQAAAQAQVRSEHFPAAFDLVHRGDGEPRRG